MLAAEADLVRRAEHAFGELAPELALLQGEPVRQGDPDRRERVLPPRGDVGRASDHLPALATADVDLAHLEPVGVRMGRELDHLADHDSGELLALRLDRIDRRA